MSLVKKIQKPLLLSLVMLLLCGLLYPLLLTGVSRVVFPSQAGGSLVMVNGEAVGSSLVGQDFTDARFMKCRPSAVGYNTYTQAQKDDGTYGGVGSGSKNYGPTNPDLAARVQADMDAFLAANPTVKKEDIPTDLLTASGSGLDPHVSPASAAIQIPGLAASTGLTEEQLTEIVKAHTNSKFLGIFGEETVNVLAVNLEIAGRLNLLS